MVRQTAEQKQADTRAKLIGAATAVFQARGYRAASLSEIAELASYSTGAIYSNFSNKEELFLAALAEVTRGQIRTWDQFLEDAETFGLDAMALGETFAAVLPVRQWSKALTEFQMEPKSEESRQAILATHRLWTVTVQRLLRAACTSNNWTPRLPIEEIATGVVSLADGLAFDSMIDPDLDIARTFATTVQLLLDGHPHADPA